MGSLSDHLYPFPLWRGKVGMEGKAPPPPTDILLHKGEDMWKKQPCRKNFG